MLNIFGTIKHPYINSGGGTYSDLTGGGLISLISNILNLLIILAGIFTLVNLILAGYGYLTSSNEPQKISNAGNKILQSVIGLAIVASTFVIASLLGLVLFKDSTALIKFTIFSLL